MIGKLYDWWCNCFNRPPRAGAQAENTCNVEAGGFGENPMQGLGCTEPPIGPDGDLPVVDPPQCYGGVGPCDPMPTLFRVAFPCKVPGSTCQTEPYLGAATGCCYGLMHFDFAGVVAEACGLTVENTATEVTLIPTESCTASATVVVGDKTLVFALAQSPGVNVADMTVTIGDCSKVYHCEGFGSCAGTFIPVVDEESEDVWPEIVVSSGAGASYAGPPVDVTPCPTSETFMDMYVVPTGPAPLFPPFQDCPSCWIIEPSGIADAFGGVSETCCNNLNGSHTLCYSPKESQGDNLIFGTPCLSRGGDCGPELYDQKRRLWQLGYNKTAQKWRLESLASIKTPAYELDDTTPCVGDTKVLTKVDVGDSGCSTAPDTITLTRGTDTQCLDCNSYVEPGCQVQLVRQCGGTNYALRHSSTVSANSKLSHICAQTRGNDIKQCCDVGCNYTPDTEPDPPCCSTQKVMYSANNDPWFDPGGTHEIWKLDLTATPVQLIGTFSEGEIVYEVDSNGLQCGKTPTQLYFASTTLPDALKALFPTNVCMVGDMLKTCNVRYMTPEQEGVDQNFLGGPCNSAGYDPDTGHEDFCACNDSCAPVIAGSIVTGANGECVSIVCASRIVAPQQDPDAKSKYSYVACATIWNEGNSQYDVLVQVMYCVGPDARWASDWYCTIGDPDATGPLTPRVCAPCSVYLGDFLGTTYADRDECGTLPAFGPPTERPPGYSGCVCGTPAPCCGGAVSEGGTVPDTIHATITDTGIGVGSTCTCGDGTVVAMVYDTGLGYWTGLASWGTCGRTITISLRCGTGFELRAEIDCDNFPYDGGWLAVSDPVCDPFSMNRIASEVSMADCCLGVVPGFASTNLRIDITA